jgi:hypothetical protein
MCSQTCCCLAASARGGRRRALSMAPTRYSDEDNLQLLREIDVRFHSRRGCNAAQKLCYHAARAVRSRQNSLLATNFTEAAGLKPVGAAKAEMAIAYRTSQAPDTPIWPSRGQANRLPLGLRVLPMGPDEPWRGLKPGSSFGHTEAGFPPGLVL